MRWPWVLRLRLEIAEQQIADLKEANAQLLEALKLSKEVLAPKDEEESFATKPHRRLGIEIRAEANRFMQRKAIEQGQKK